MVSRKTPNTAVMHAYLAQWNEREADILRIKCKHCETAVCIT